MESQLHIVEKKLNLFGQQKSGQNALFLMPPEPLLYIHVEGVLVSALISEVF
jgi:hypothetical protein